MDQPSKDVIRFLEALSALAWGNVLYGGSDGLWVKLVRRGLQPTRPGSTITVSAGPQVSLVLGMSANITSEKELDFVIELSRDSDGWLIETGVFVDRWPEGEGQRVVRSFSDRRAATLDECLAQLSSAVVDLASCDDVVDQDL